MAAVAVIASTAASEPGSSCRSAISAEASRIDAGSASGTACRGLGFSLGSRGGAPLSDQLVGERAGRIAPEQPAHTLDRGAAALDLRVRLLDGPCHRRIVAAASTRARGIVDAWTLA